MAKGDRHVDALECAVAARYEVWSRGDYYVLVMFDDADEPLGKMPLSAAQLATIAEMANKAPPRERRQ